MEIHISKCNRKMGAVPSFSLPPVTTCTNCASCAKKCYARRMAARYPSVARAYEDNLCAVRSDLAGAFAQIERAARLSSVFRYHVSGDIPGADYFAQMVETARRVPSCTFLAFTKNYTVVNAYIDNGGAIPENLKIIFSGWGSALRPKNPHGMPESDVIFKGQLAPVGEMICGGNCADCRCQGVGCWTIQPGQKIYFYEH